MTGEDVFNLIYILVLRFNTNNKSASKINKHERNEWIKQAGKSILFTYYYRTIN